MIANRIRIHMKLLLLAALLATTITQNGHAQERQLEQERKLDANSWISFTAPKTLDQVRELNEKQKSSLVVRGESLPRGAKVGNRFLFADASNVPVVVQGVAAVPDPRKAALARIREIQKELFASDGEEEEVEAELKSALAAYFVVDMQHRVRELDEIKAQVAETEAKLQRRLDSQQEVVDLQLKLTLAEANGLGFFNEEGPVSRMSSSGPGVPGSRPRTTSVVGRPGPANIPLAPGVGR